MRRLGWLLLGACPAARARCRLAAAEALPPPIGPETPRVEPIKEDDGLYTQSWFQLSFLDLREDFNEAKAEGKRFAVIFEQRGCPYCIKMHTESCRSSTSTTTCGRTSASCSSTCGARAKSPTSTART